MKRFLSVVLALICLLSLAACVQKQSEPISEAAEFPTPMPLNEREELLRKVGKMSAENILSYRNETGSEKKVVEAEDFSLSKDAFERNIALSMLNGKMNENEAQEHALRFITFQSMYYAALHDGVVVDEEAVRAEVAQQRQLVESAAEENDPESGGHDYVVMMEELEKNGVTKDEYWELTMERWIKDDTIIAYTQRLYDAYLENGGSADDEAAYVRYCMEKTQEAIDAQHVILHGVKWKLTEENYMKNYWPAL